MAKTTDLPAKKQAKRPPVALHERALSDKEPLVAMLSYARSITPSRGLLYACSNLEGSEAEPLIVEKRGLRGTKSFDIWAKVERAKKAADEGDKNNRLEDALQPNPQCVEGTYLPENKPYLMNRFQVKYLCKTDRPHMCSDVRIMKSLMDLVSGFGRIGGFSLLARCYVAPLVTGLWMFRNNDEAMTKHITICNTTTGKRYVFTPGYNQFTLESLPENQQAMAVELAELIEQALTQKLGVLRLEVTAIYEMGAGMPVYPSQEMDVGDKKDTERSRKLYQVKANGTDHQAGFHDVKLGNALRTIDIWHGHDVFGPTPIEPLGVVSTHMVSLRLDERRDFFSLLKKHLFSWIEQLKTARSLDDVDSPDDLCFVMAVLVRGGAFV